MKTVKSFAKIIIALLMAFTLVTLTACDVLDDFFGKGGEEGGTGDGNVYHVTLETNDGNFTEDVTEYTSGTACPLPENGTKEHYTFDGWYADSSFSGNKVLQIPTGAKGDKTYYAKWDPDTYLITYNISGEASTQDTYSYNEEKTLEVPTKSGYTFNGWYSNQNLTGSKVTKITAGEYGIKTFYGEWKSGGTSANTYNVTLNKNGGTTKTELTQYTQGVGADLPEMNERNGYNFEGWFDNEDCTGTAVTSIPSNATGDKTYWAKFTPISADALQLSAYGGYEEGAYVEFALDSKVSLDNVTVSYNSNDLGSKTLSGNDKTYLVRRLADGTVRADIVGIAEGTCQITINANGKTATKTVNVSAYDRSGYAHFDSSASDMLYANGVGGYNNDGTPKNKANIVYVSEETKNATFTVESKTYTGIVGVLKGASALKYPLIVRIIGTISAPTWKKDNVVYTKTKDNTQDGTLTGKLKASVIVGKNGKKLPTDSKQLTQAALISGGYNDLESGITELIGLSSSASYKSNSDANKCEWDSCWNDCQIDSAKNVTLEGIGTDAMIFQWGLTWKKCSSIEVRNITFDDYTEDACSFEGSTDSTYTGMKVDKFNSNRLWVHNNTFNQGINYWDVCAEQDKHEGDGATDFKRCAYISIAYNNYYNNHKTGLIGADDNVTTANVTFHHNFYEICDSRLPLARQANMHMYNNYYYGSTGTNMSIRSGAYAFIEACYFENAANPIVTQLGKADKLLTGYGRLDGYVKAYNCIFTGKQVDTKNYNVTITSDRKASVSNDNIFDDQFDLDSKMFYLNSDGTTKALLTDANQARFDCVNKAGVHKPSNYVKITTDAQLSSFHSSRAIKK